MDGRNTKRYWCTYRSQGFEMDANQRCTDSRPNADSALLIRARRLAQRSRAAAACPPCKKSKLRCSDYRPCARCKKSGLDVCMDFPVSNRGYQHATDIYQMSVSMDSQPPAQDAPRSGSISGALGSDRSAEIKPATTDRSQELEGCVGKSPMLEFDSAKSDGSSSWTFSTSTNIAAPVPCALNLMPSSNPSTAFHSNFASREAAHLLHHLNGAMQMKRVLAEWVDLAKVHQAVADQVR